MSKNRILSVVLFSSMLSISSVFAMQNENMPKELPPAVDIGNVVSMEEWGKMKRFVENRIKPQDIRGTLTIYDGDIVDCVDVENQPALKGKALSRLAERIMRENANSATSDDSEGLEQEAEQLYGSDGVYCPEATIPIRRITMETLKRFETLDDYFAKIPKKFRSQYSENDPTSDPADLDKPPYAIVTNKYHKRVFAKISYDASIKGGRAKLNTWTPYVEKDSEFSLAQIWVWANPSYVGSVEAGWQVDRERYGDSKAHFFIYYTGAHYDSRYSCYNLDCDTFVQVDNTVAIGGAYTGSTLNGTQYVTTIEIQQKEDENWWVKRGSKWVGYYPKSAFASNNLQSGAEHFDLGGEVAWTPRETYCSWDTWFGCLAHSTRNARFTHTDMGSGVRPDGISDYGEVAYIRQIEYLNSSQEWTRIKEHTADRVSLKGSDGNCYDLATNLDNSDWMGSTIWYGGPGYGDYCK